jgi:hypothetical protein
MSSTSSSLSSRDGRSVVVAVSERAQHVVVVDENSREIARQPLVVVPGEVVTVRF